jgi:hypothetical protein
VVVGVDRRLSKYFDIIRGAMAGLGHSTQTLIGHECLGQSTQTLIEHECQFMFQLPCSGVLSQGALEGLLSSLLVST